MAQHFAFVARIIFCILLLTSATEAFSQVQPMKFERISTEQGLSSTGVFCILQDSKGFLWFGTTAGLNRYDGYHFMTYRNDPDDPKSLSLSWIKSLCEDTSGALWVGTEGGGLNKFDRSTGSSVRFKHDPANPKSLSNDWVRCVYTDRAGTLWVGTRSGLNMLDHSTSTFTHYLDEPSSPNSKKGESVHAIFEDRNGALWIGTERNGLVKFDRSSNKFVYYKHDPGNRKSLTGNFVLSIVEDQAGTLWVSADGLNKLDRKTETFTQYVKDPNAGKICIDRAGRVLMGTEGNGLYILDPATGLFTRFKNDPTNPHSLSGDSVGPIYEDSSGTLWIGTYGNGLNKVSPSADRFAHFKNPQSAASNAINAISQDDSGMLLIGTAGGGLQRLDPATGFFTHLNFDPGNLYTTHIEAICRDKSGTVWVGINLGGLDMFDPSMKRFINFRHDDRNPTSLRHNQVWCIYEGRDGTLWIGTTRGVDAFDPSTNTFKHVDNEEETLGKVPVVSLCEDSFGALWIGTLSGGLYKLERPSNHIIHYETDSDNPRSLGANVIASICEAKDRTLWIGTYGGGLNKFDRATNTFERFTEENGSPNNNICGILEDSKGNLWVSTVKGISRFDSRNRTFRNFDVSDGLQGEEFGNGAYYKNKMGEMFFGGPNGFNMFHPDSIKENRFIPPIVISEFRLFNKPMYQDLAEGQQIELSYADNFFSFEFAALDFSKPGRNQYAYKMEGFNKDWVYSGSERLATYTALDPGEYTFRVKGSNSDGVWNEKGTSVKIVVTPPWWKTWWFQGAAGLILALAFGGSVRQISTRRLRKRVAELDRAQLLEAERSRISRNMHDDLGARLTELSLGIELIKRELEESTPMGREMQKVSDTTREIVGTFDEIVWTVNPENDTLDNVASALSHYVSKYLSNAQIRCRLDIPTILPERRIPAETCHNILMVVKEAIHNIVKHAVATEVSLQVSLKDSLLEATVTGNGKGFVVDSASPFSDGLKNMKKRMEDVGGKFEVTSELNKGTEIRIAVPLT